MKAVRRVGLGVALAFLLASGATASPIHIGGIDLLTHYTYDAGQDLGVLTFGTGADFSLVTTVDDPNPILDPLRTAAVHFEAQVDTNGYDIQNSLTRSVDASLIGTSETTHLRFLDSGTFELLLAFELSHLDVTNFTGANDSAILGDQDPQSTRSLLTISCPAGAAGDTCRTIAAPFGGEGTSALLEVLLTESTGSGTSPINWKQRNPNMWAIDWDADNTLWNLNVIAAPEPGTGSLLLFSLVGLSAWRRRHR